MTAQKKYEFTGETKTVFGRTLHQIRALVAISALGVVAGDIGGWIEHENNLSHGGNAWVSGNAWVYGDAQVYGDARVYGDAWVYGNAQVSGNARVYGDAQVHGDAQVSGNAWVSGNARVYGNARVSDNAECLWFSKVGSENGTLTACRSKDGIWVSRGCFSGSLEEFEDAVLKTHSDSQTAKEYALLIDFIRLRASSWKAREADPQEAAA